uniref:NTPase, KAP family P-loop domain containing 1 n=1 Tax=Mastacembelus armatus TaxID=205130 RepID=A0A3Q3L7V1_9TELE
LQKNKNKNDIYAYALSKTLTDVSSPATVGLYSSCQDRINMILRQMEGQEYKGRPKPRSVKLSFKDFLTLIFRLLFFRPIWTVETKHHHNVRFIYVHFGAWHFAGSDLLWAGVALRLFQAMQMNFGKLQLALYRVAQHNEEEEVTKKIVEDGPNNWQSKKICCCPLWFLALSVLVVLVIILVFLLTFGLPKVVAKPGEEMNETNGHMGVLAGLFIAVLGIPVPSVLRFIFHMFKNLIFSQDLTIKKGMDNKQISSQLGFMNEVRKEMCFLSCFIQFMEIFERRRIRVVLKITNLDRCSPQKIVAVLEAINILLSDEESPFISVLAVNPDVLVQKLKFADGCFSKEDRAYALLNHIVTLAFTVPPLCIDSKSSLFYSLRSNSEVSQDIQMRKYGARKLNKISSSDTSSIEMSDLDPLMNTTTAPPYEQEEDVDKVMRVLISSESNLNKYMLDDAMFMRRVINSIRVILIIMLKKNIEVPQPEYIAAWVVLATEWPCRLSWIIQCVEDDQQRADFDHNNVANTGELETLWEVFNESRAELYVMSAQIEDLLEQDGDPEMFERFLKIDFQFTIKDLKSFEVITVNLDHSIRNELAQIRGVSRLKDFGLMSKLAPLPIGTVINMTTEDVCKELERMKYPSRYTDIVKSNDLHGLALIFGNAEQLKDLLGMTFGEWVTFRLHFLGLPSYLQPKKASKCSSK